MNTQEWILLAEDNANDADLALRALSFHPAPKEVIVARDGAEALDCLYCRAGHQARDSGNPILILLDLKMPKVDGLEVLRQIKGDAQLKTIPVVVFTSSREASDLARTYELGANAYVVKPVDFQQFIATLIEVKTFWMVTNEPAPQPTQSLQASRNWPEPLDPASSAPTVSVDAHAQVVARRRTGVRREKRDSHSLA